MWKFIIYENPVKPPKYADKIKGRRKLHYEKGAIYTKRQHKIRDYMHKASAYIVNQLVSNNIHTLILGYNKKWKQDINIGKINNQNFVQVPFYIFKEMLSYKCRLHGITIIEKQLMQI